MSRASWAPWPDGQPFWGGSSEVSVSVVELSELYPVGRRPPLVAYIRQLWQRRHFIWADARAKALGSQRGTFLGNAWLIAKPMLDAIVYFLVFGLLLQTSRGIDNFIGYLIIGVTFFPPLQRAVTGGSQVIVTGRNLIRGFSFPRAALPASYTIRSAIDLVPPMIALLVLVVVLPPHAWPSWHWVLIVPVLALQVLLSLGLTSGGLPHHDDDPGHAQHLALPDSVLVLRLGSLLLLRTVHPSPGDAAGHGLNPGYLIITMYRDVILYQRVPQPRMWLILSAWSLGLTAVSFVFFWEKEEAYGVER